MADKYINLSSIDWYEELFMKGKNDSGVWVRYRDIERLLREAPAADVRPVVHGHYIGEYDGYADGNPVYDMWYCSECGCFFEDWDEKPTYNFCPNCGADMREVL